MVPDVATGDPTRMLCLHCARKTVSPKSVGRYEGLTRYLKFRAAFTGVVKLSLAEVDGIIRDNLPLSAYRDEGWWDNSLRRLHAKAWLNAGWEVQEVDLKRGYVVFQKVKALPTKSGRKRPSSSLEKKPFAPVPVHFPKSRKPSKTRVARLYAKLKNIERQEASMPKYRGSFKPKPKHEKKLFKPEKKPR